MLLQQSSAAAQARLLCENKTTVKRRKTKQASMTAGGLCGDHITHCNGLREKPHEGHFDF